MCCEPIFDDQEEHDRIHADQCPECGGDIDAEGKTCDMNNCHYSPVECEICGWQPCDLSC